MKQQKQILLTRLPEDNKQDRLYFEKNFFDVIEIPLLELKPMTLSESVKQSLYQTEWILLTSQHAAKFLLMHESKELFQRKKIGVIGHKTGEVLVKQDIVPCFQSPIPAKLQFFDSWYTSVKKPTSVFYPKSNLADSSGEAWLRNKGCHVSAPVLYKNFFPEAKRQLLHEQLEKRTITAVFFTSPSIWHRFFEVYRQIDSHWKPEFYCIGATTQKQIQKAGYHAKIMSTVLK